MTYASTILGVRPAGEPECSSGVPRAVAAMGMLGALALGYVFAGAGADERVKAAYKAGKRRAPSPVLI